MELEKGGKRKVKMKMKRGISSLWPQAIAINLIKSCGFLAMLKMRLLLRMRCDGQ